MKTKTKKKKSVKQKPDRRFKKFVADLCSDESRINKLQRQVAELSTEKSALKILFQKLLFIHMKRSSDDNPQRAILTIDDEFEKLNVELSDRRLQDKIADEIELGGHLTL